VLNAAVRKIIVKYNMRTTTAKLNEKLIDAPTINGAKIENITKPAISPIEDIVPNIIDIIILENMKALADTGDARSDSNVFLSFSPSIPSVTKYITGVDAGKRIIATILANCAN
jgi:hypothetical protein